MLPSPEPGPPIGIVVPTAAMPRYVLFEMMLEGLWVTNGSQLARHHGAALGVNLNKGTEAVLAENVEYVFYMDDDHTFKPFIAQRLAKHGLPIVVGLTASSRPPFAPVIYKHRTETPEGWKYQPYDWTDLDGKSGLMEVYASGRAGMMVRRDVFDKLERPWWRVGQINADQANEDFDFCERVRALGYKVMVDLSTPFGHMSPCGVTPTVDAKGRWVIKFEWENFKGFTSTRSP